MKMGMLGFNSGLTCDFILVTYPESWCPYLSKLGIMKLLPYKLFCEDEAYYLHEVCGT